MLLAQNHSVADRLELLNDLITSFTTAKKNTYPEGL